MNTKILLALFNLTVAGTAAATTQLIDKLPPELTGVNHPPNFYDATFQSSINDTQFSGQNVSLNLLFDGFIRAFTATPKVHPQPLLFDLYLSYQPRWPGILPPDGSPSVIGTATLLGATGEALGDPTALNVALDGGPTWGPDVQMWFTPSFEALPSDIYGIRYDLKLSDSSGKSFGVSEPYPFDQLAIYGLFGVGPGRLPRDIVPESGSAAALLAMGLLALFAFNGKHAVRSGK